MNKLSARSYANNEGRLVAVPNRKMTSAISRLTSSGCLRGELNGGTAALKAAGLSEYYVPTHRRDYTRSHHQAHRDGRVSCRDHLGVPPPEHLRGNIERRVLWIDGAWRDPETGEKTSERSFLIVGDGGRANVKGQLQLPKFAPVQVRHQDSASAKCFIDTHEDRTMLCFYRNYRGSTSRTGSSSSLRKD
jgi:hypothetical protein